MNQLEEVGVDLGVQAVEMMNVGRADSVARQECYDHEEPPVKEWKHEAGLWQCFSRPW